MRYINKLIIGLTVFTGFSCTDFLKEEPKSSLSPSTYYNNDSQARIGVNSIYSTLRNNFVTGGDIKYVPTDLIVKPSWSMEEGLGDYTFSSNNNKLQLMWKNHYLAIKDCNSTIDAIEAKRAQIPSADRFIAEVRGVRAFLYFDLVRWYGDVPLVLHPATTPNSSELKVPRDDKKVIFQQILEDLDFASKNCPNKNANNGFQYGRFSQDAAWALMAKVHLYIASITQRDNKVIINDAVTHYTKAIESAQHVIDGGNYTLTSYYPDAFDYQTETKAQEEVIFCSNRLTGDGTGGWTGMVLGIQGDLANGGSWGMASSSDFHRSIYEKSDSIRRLWNCPRVSVQSNGTLKGWDYPAYYQGLLPTAEKTDGMGFSIGKFRRYPLVNPAAYNYQNFGMDEPLIRFADVLLIYAEAYNELHHGPGAYTPSTGLSLDGKNIQSAYDAVNVVRKRARTANVGLVHQDVLPRVYNLNKQTDIENCVPDWKPGFYGLYSNDMDNYTFRGYADDYTAFSEEILWERAREFVAETTDRWCDLTRRGVLVEKLKAVRTTVIPYLGRTERNLTAPSFPENVKATHQLLPIPLSEIDSNDKLNQNPGY